MENKEPIGGTPSKTPPPSTSSATPPRRRVWPWIVAALLILVLLWVFFGRSKNAPTETNRAGGGGRSGAGQAVVIDTTNAHTGDINVYISALGTVTPYYIVSNRTRVDGQIMEVKYQEGQLVHQGDPLVEIDPAPFEAAVVQAEGQVARDKALLENARLDLDRYKEAYSKNAIPKQQLDTQVSTVHQYEGIVQLDQGQLTNAQVQLNYTHLKAPITGRVGLRLVDPGNIVHASDNSPIVIITQMQPITVVFSIAEDFLPEIQKQLKQGRQLKVDALDRSQQKKIASGVLQTLDNQIDPTTGTLKLKAVFTNEDETLFPNQFVNARLLVDTHRDVTLLPNPVIQHNAQGAYVFVVDSSGTNQTVAIKPVEVVTTEGDMSQVSGIEPGTVVAASNFTRLTDGGKITVRKPGEGRQKNGTNTVEKAGDTNSAPRKSRRQTNNPE